MRHVTLHRHPVLKGDYYVERNGHRYGVTKNGNYWTIFIDGDCCWGYSHCETLDEVRATIASDKKEWVDEFCKAHRIKYSDLVS